MIPEAMLLLSFTLCGLCIGVLAARAQVPRTDPPAVTAVLLLDVIVVLGAVALGADLADGLVFLAGQVVGAVLYSASLWRRHGLGSRFTRFELVWMSTVRPRYLRDCYAAENRGEPSP